MAIPQEKYGAPGRGRTYDTRLRRAVLYPLSYERVRPKNTTALVGQSIGFAAGRLLRHAAGGGEGGVERVEEGFEVEGLGHAGIG